jgi:hypothetical protein
MNVDLPKEIWLHIFSSLPLKELVRASEVCKYWNELAKTDTLWLERARNYQENVPAHMAQSRVKASHNGLKGRFSTKEFLGEHHGLGFGHAYFTLNLKDEIYAVFNSSNYIAGCEVWKIGVEERQLFATSEHGITAQIFCEEQWVGVSYQGEAYCYELATGKKMWQFAIANWPKNPENVNAACSGRYLALALDSSIRLVEIPTGRICWEHRLEKDAWCRFVALTDTHLVFDAIGDGLDLSTFSFQPLDETSQALANIEINAVQTVAKGKYLVTLDRKAKLTFYWIGKERWECLGEVKHNYKRPTKQMQYAASMCLADNLLCISREGLLAIYDVRDSSLKFSTSYATEDLVVTCNGSKVLTRAGFRQFPTKGAHQYKYTLYDLENPGPLPVPPLPAPPIGQVEEVRERPGCNCLIS